MNSANKSIVQSSILLTEMEMLEIYGSMDWTAKINWWCENRNCAKSAGCYRKRKKRKK